MGLMIITGHGIEDAEGAGTPIWEPDGYMIDEVPINGWNVPHAARGPNNIVYRVWQDDDYAIRVSYTANNGSSWGVSTVIASTFEGMTSAGIGGLVVLANNTTCVYFTTYEGEDTYNSYVAFRWNWAGAWEIREIYGGTSAVTAYPKMALNGTHLLFMSVSGGNTLRGKTYNLATDTFSTPPVTTPKLWAASWNNAYDYDITVNQSGKFIIASESWSGSTYRYYVRDYDKDHAVVYADTQHSVAEVYCINLMCKSDDTLVFGFAWYWNGMTTYGLEVMYQTVPWTGVTRVIYNNLGAAGPGLDVYSLGSNIDENDRIYFYWANDTLTGGDVYISKVSGEFDYTTEEWDAAIVDRVYDYGTHDDEWYASSWYDGRYPIVGGYSVNIPITGWMGHHIWKDEVGSPDDYAFALYWNATFYWYEYNLPPVGSSPFPSNGSSGITLTPTCRITVSDADSDPMDISWLENTTGSWVERHDDSGVSNGTFSFQFTQFSAYSTTYYWRINLTDGTDNVTYIFHFTTRGNLAPIIAFPSPGNGSTSSPSPTTSITVGDIDFMDVDWLEWTGGSWVLRQRSTGISSGVYTWVFSGATEDNETYYWAVNATDGLLNATKTFHFTVEITTPTEDDDEELNLETLDYGLFIGLWLLIIVVIIAGLGAIIKYTRDDA